MAYLAPHHRHPCQGLFAALFAWRGTRPTECPNPKVQAPRAQMSDTCPNRADDAAERPVWDAPAHWRDE